MEMIGCGITFQTLVFHISFLFLLFITPSRFLFVTVKCKLLPVPGTRLIRQSLEN